ncbi:hypothetical protein Tco_1539716 [Tanacetum coccineum]
MGLLIKPVSYPPPSPDYIPGPEDPQTPLHADLAKVPQDEDEREPMFVQAHDPEHAIPPVDSPTAESPGYVTESDPEEDTRMMRQRMVRSIYLCTGEWMEIMMNCDSLGMTQKRW